MEKYVEERLTKICRALEVEIELTTDEKDQKVHPAFDGGAIMSKLYSLMVFAGWNVQAMPPSYTRVHADIEFWKGQIAADALKDTVVADQLPSPGPDAPAP